MQLTEDGAATLGGRMVFICGLHRSGTSLIHRCMGDHPDISAFANTGAPEDEGQHLQSVYPTARAHGGPGRFGLDPAAHLTESSPLVTESNRRRLADEWLPHWDLSKRILVEKSPPNLVRIRFLRAMFPGSRFIVITRHPAVIACATQRSAVASLTSLVQHWVVCHETMRADTSGMDGVRVLRYEDFVSDPAATLGAVHGWLGLPPGGVGEPVRTGINDKYLRQWRRRSWHDPLRLDQRIAAMRYERRVRPFGYSLMTLAAG